MLRKRKHVQKFIDDIPFNLGKQWDIAWYKANGKWF